MILSLIVPGAALEMNSTANTTDIETDRDVKLLVGHFYPRVREDSVLGPMFDEIGEVDWVEHIPTMCEFWETVLFHRSAYKGDPLRPHVELNRKMQEVRAVELDPKDFARWIALFHETVDELFAGARAEHAKGAASRMAEHMMAAISKTDHPLGIVSNGPADGPADGLRGFDLE